MAQDLRERFKQEREVKMYRMKKGHENRFVNRLEVELPCEKKHNYLWLKIAACIAVVTGIVVYNYNSSFMDTPQVTTVIDLNRADVKEEISLGDLSPDLKKVEHYYVANINMALSKLQVSKENKGLVDSFMNQLADLNMEYERLNTELNQIGPNDQTITALIENLQYRLQLLKQLKKKLNELNSSRNEQDITNSI